MAIQFDPPTNIVLTGFMGVGKTTIGRRVAEFVQRTFIDTDDVITARAGITIPQIFAQHGEAFFRKMEHTLAKDLAAETRLVIATGGGMLVNEDNRTVLMKTGFLVCLDAPPELIEARLKDSQTRPLAANWRELYEARKSAYAAIPMHVSVLDRTADQVAQEVIRLWRASM